jgi:hypothetical protein
LTKGYLKPISSFAPAKKAGIISKREGDEENEDNDKNYKMRES